MAPAPSSAYILRWTSRSLDAAGNGPLRVPSRRSEADSLSRRAPVPVIMSVSPEKVERLPSEPRIRPRENRVRPAARKASRSVPMSSAGTASGSLLPRREIRGLLIGELIDLHTNGGELQPGHLLVDGLRNLIDHGDQTLRFLA